MGPAVQHGCSSWSGAKRNDATSVAATRFVVGKLPAVPDVEMGAEEPCTAQVKRSKTIMGLEICVLKAQDDVYDETPGTPTNLAETSGENATDDDIVAPEVTEKLNRLKTLGRIYIAPSVDQLRPLRYVYSQRTNDPLDDRMVAESRKRETALRLGTLEALRMIVSFAATRDGKHRPRSRAFYDIVAAFVHASIDEVVGTFSRGHAGERRVLLAVDGALLCSNGFETVAAALYESTEEARVEFEQGDGLDSFTTETLLERAGVMETTSLAEGSNALLDRLDRVMTDEFDAKMLGRVGRGYFAEIKFLKRTLRGHDRAMCFSWSGSTRYVTELGVFLGLTDSRAATETRTPGTTATGGGAPLDTFQAATFRSAVGLIRYIVLGRPDCQYAPEAVTSATREPTKLNWR